MNNLTFYHGSNADFKFPDFNVIDAIDDSKPLKVLLGLYVTPNKELVVECGMYVYEVVLSNECVQFDLPLSSMKKQYNRITDTMPRDIGIQSYIASRNSYASFGIDLINVIEPNELTTMSEHIVVNLNAIKSFTKIKG